MMKTKKESPVAYVRTRPLKGNLKKVIQHTNNKDVKARILASVINQATYTEAVYRKNNVMRKGFGRRIESMNYAEEVATLDKNREAHWLAWALNDLYNNIIKTSREKGIHVTPEHLLLSLLHYYQTKYERG